MSRARVLGATLAAIGWLLPALAAAQTGVPGAARPEVLLLIDDAVDWEDHFVSGVPPEAICAGCVGGHPNLCATEQVTLQEVLAGSFDDPTMTCEDRQSPAGRPDAIETTPHFFVADTTQSAGDGLLDQLSDTVKFALMTGDHAPAPEQLLSGEYSYGTNVTCSLDFGAGLQVVTYNLGAKGPWATYGAMVPFEPTEGAAAVAAANAAVQASLVSDRPWGSLHLAALLSDAREYLATDGHFQPYDPGVPVGDPYEACRQRAVVLIVKAEQDETWVDPVAGCLDSAVAHAAEIAQTHGTPVHVISYRASAIARTTAEQVALAGGTDAAYHVTTPEALRARLSSILDALTRYGASFAGAATTTATRSPSDALYEVFAGHVRSFARYDPIGVLSNLIFRCLDCSDEVSDGGPEACELFDLAGALTARQDSTRTVWTQIGAAATPFDAANMTADLLDLPTVGPLADLKPATPCGDGESWDPTGTLGDASDPAVREQVADDLVGFIRGDETSRRCDRALGAIRYAAPVISAAPTLNLSAPGYAVFKNEVSTTPGQRDVKDRPTVVYAQTHVGMLHALRLDHPPDMLDIDYGQELWAYVPGMLLPRLKELPAAFDFLLDGPLVVRDVLTRTTPDMTLEEVAAAWRTILVGSCGMGCRGLYALDVTDPTQPAFLWEVSPGLRCFDNPDEGQGCVATADFDRLGQVIGRPEVGLVYVANTLGVVDSHQRGVVVVPGGLHSGPPGNPQRIGESVFVLDALTGQVVQEFRRSSGGPSNVNPPGQWTHGFTGTPTGYNTLPGRIMTKAFVGDADGQLWRLDLSDTDPADWEASRFFDLNDVAPGSHAAIYHPPTLATDDTWGGMIVTFSSGGNRDLTNATAENAIAAVRERFDYGSGLPVLDPELLWSRAFDLGEVPTSAPLTYNRVTWWSTYRNDAGDPCGTGDSRVYGARFAEDDGGGGPMGAIDDAAAATTLYYEWQNLVITGLQLVLRPSCVGEIPDTWQQGGGSPTAGTTSSGSPSLVATTGPGGTSSGGQTPASAAAAAPVASIALPVQGTPRNVFYSSWGLLFD